MRTTTRDRLALLLRDHPGASQTELAAMLGVTRQCVQKVLATLPKRPAARTPSAPLAPTYPTGDRHHFAVDWIGRVIYQPPAP